MGIGTVQGQFVDAEDFLSGWKPPSHGPQLVAYNPSLVGIPSLRT